MWCADTVTEQEEAKDAEWTMGEAGSGHKALQLYE